MQGLYPYMNKKKMQVLLVKMYNPVTRKYTVEFIFDQSLDIKREQFPRTVLERRTWECGMGCTSIL